MGPQMDSIFKPASVYPFLKLTTIPQWKEIRPETLPKSYPHSWYHMKEWKFGMYALKVLWLQSDSRTEVKHK